MIYNKLVRDRIPELIEQQGEKAVTRVLDDAEYQACLENKLDEEVREYHADKSLEELADILEVVYSLAENAGYTQAELSKAYQKKHTTRGGFEKRIFLISKER